MPTLCYRLPKRDNGDRRFDHLIAVEEKRAWYQLSILIGRSSHGDRMGRSRQTRRTTRCYERNSNKATWALQIGRKRPPRPDRELAFRQRSPWASASLSSRTRTARTD